MFLFYVLSFFKKGDPIQGDPNKGGTLFKDPGNTVRLFHWATNSIVC